MSGCPEKRSRSRGARETRKEPAVSGPQSSEEDMMTIKLHALEQRKIRPRENQPPGDLFPSTLRNAYVQGADNH